MSVSRLLGLMSPAVSDAIYVGSYTHNEFSDVVDFHADAQVEDFAAVVCLGLISGGSGAAWTSLAVAGAFWNLHFRKLQEDDLTVPITVAANSPVVTMVWRGPSSLVQVQTGGQTTDGVALAISGFTKNQAAIALLSVMYSDENGGVGAAKSPPFSVANVVAGPANYRMTVGAGLTSTYVDGTSLNPDPGLQIGDRFASIFELRY